MLFLHWIATNPAFVSGDLDTGLVAREWPPAQPEELPLEVLLLALALEQEHGSADMSLSNPWAQTGGWRAGGASRRYRYDWHGQMMEVVASQTRDNLWKVRRQGTELHDVRLDPADGGRIGARVGTKVVRGFGVVGTESLDISWKGVRYRLRRPVPAGTGTGGSGASGGERLTAPMPGTIVRVLTRAGQHVSAHEPLVVMEAMKMEHVIEAPHAGTVREVLYDEGDMVPAGSPLVRLDEE
jgi:3-methylcrotonyl-CoA carboxylase alpha subunit